MNNLSDLLQKNHIPFSEKEPLSRHCTWKIGGEADYFIQPRSENEIAKTLELLDVNKIPFAVIGRGSNVLFDDLGFRGAVLNLGRNFSGWTADGSFMTVKSGTWVPLLAKASAALGLSGLESAVGVPGNLGGLLTMNGGSMRQNIGQAVKEVRCMDFEGHVFSLSPEECDFSYRHSVFQRGDKIILEAKLSLVQAKANSVRSAMASVLKERKSKFPLKYPNCGSVFSNRGDIFEKWGAPGKVIETCGLKGLRVGDIKISEKHGNFALNLGKGSSKDVIKLIRAVRHAVRDITGFDIPCEVLYLPPEGKIAPLHTA